MAAVAASAPALAIPERAALQPEALLAQLRGNTQGALFDTALDRSSYRILHSRGAQPLLQDDTKAPALDRARFFLSVYGPLMGVQDPLAELRGQRISKDRAGNSHVHLDQTYQGLPVFGARLVVHMNGQGVTGVNGVFVKGLDGLSTTPGIDKDAAGRAAIALTQKRHPGKVLSVESSRLMVYRSDLLDGRHTGRNYLAYEVVVTAGPSTGVRERYILDAKNGAALNRIDGIETAKNRAIHTPTVSTPAVMTEGSATAPADVPLINDDRSAMSSRAGVVPPTPLGNLYVFAGGTYDLYNNMFGRGGYDDGYIDPLTNLPKVQIQHSTYLANENCPNAYWDGIGTNYCPAFDGDDVVSHEWSHAYTEYTHGLYYQYQAGALNESYSDIFGETYDLVNGIEGLLGANLVEGSYYSDTPQGSRWLIGEDLSQAAVLALLRDMWDPDNFPALLSPQPGRVTAPNYDCTGEPHNNSGVPNHAYAMLVDGKDYNGVTVPGIGIVKAAHIYFQAETHYQTPSTNFAQHADALEQSCQDLIGVSLNDPTGAVSADRITAADCDAVHAAMLATEMRTSDIEQCGFTGTLLQPESTTPAICTGGTFENPDFSESFASASFPAGWTLGHTVTGDSPYVPGWVLTKDFPEPHGSYAAFRVDYNHGGLPGSGGDSSSHSTLDTPEVTVSDDQSYFHFNHYILSEGSYDGGNLKYSLNGADFVVLPATAMTYNAYSGTMADAPPISGGPGDPTGLFGNNTSPLAGQAGWFGTDPGENTSEWGTTVVNLKTLGAKRGDKLKFRFDFGQDSTGGDYGWMVDDVVVSHCALTPPSGSSSGGGSGSSSGGSSSGAGSGDSAGRFGGALNLLLLLPLLAAGLRRRRS